MAQCMQAKKQEEASWYEDAADFFLTPEIENKIEEKRAPS